MDYGSKKLNSNLTDVEESVAGLNGKFIYESQVVTVDNAAWYYFAKGDIYYILIKLNEKGDDMTYNVTLKDKEGTPLAPATTAEQVAYDNTMNVKQAIDSRISDEEYEVLNQRMNNFASLPDGSTAGDAELQDIRVGYDGTTYESAGEAVRGQVSGLKSALNDLSEMNPSEGSQIYDIMEYGAEKWDGKRISGTTIVDAGSNYYGYILDRSKIEKEVRLVVSNNPTNVVIINEQNPEIGSTISVSETLIATSTGSGGYQYTITPGEGYILFYRQGEFSYAFVCEEINLFKDLDIPGGTCISGSLDFTTKGNYSGFKLPDIPSDTIVFLKVSDDVNLISVQIQDISGEAAEGITTQVNTNSTVICWISNGKPAMLRYGKSNNTSYQTLYETMKISIVCLDQGGIQEFKKKNAIGNSIMCGIYANNKNDSLFLSLFADYLECDIRKSSDGTYVLNHNATYAGYAISDTELTTLQEQGIWTLDELYRFVSECDLGLALDAKVEIADSDIRKAHAITRGKNVIVAGNQFSEPPFYFTIYHQKANSGTEEYKERVLYDAGNTIENPELRNGLNAMVATGDLTNLSNMVNGIDVIEYDVTASKATLTSLYGCVF